MDLARSLPSYGRLAFPSAECFIGAGLGPGGKTKDLRVVLRLSMQAIELLPYVPEVRLCF